MTTAKKPRTKKPAAAPSEAIVSAPQILPHGSVAPVMAAPFTAAAPFVKKKPTWA
jgi:hypothetical protein